MTDDSRSYMDINDALMEALKDLDKAQGMIEQLPVSFDVGTIRFEIEEMIADLHTLSNYVASLDLE